VASIHDILTRRLDPAWKPGEPSSLLPEYAERMAALVSAEPQIAQATAIYAGAIAGADDLTTLQSIRNAALSREAGAFTEALALMPSLSVDEKRVSGKALNLGKALVEAAEKAKRESLERARAGGDAIDVTLPGRRPWSGRPHVLAQVRDELLDLFHGLGFSVYTSPEVELESYNFGKLNFAPDHPARDAHDTYFVSPEVLLRTHTSPGWVRAMEERKPPLRLVFPGRVYRAEAVDASHMDQFHQMDGLFVAKNVSMADLKATLNTFARAIYRRDVPTRIIPIYFPFVEPGVQMDVQCATCSGTGRFEDKRCPVCKGTKWVEVLGAGMVHPNVFRSVGYDPENVTGFAFGMGLERITMGRHGIHEIREFLQNDLRFLEQF